MAGRPSKALERRDGILDAMEDCVREHGIALSSMRRIADRSGLSLQMISHYFGNRHSLVLAFVERLCERLHAETQVAETGHTPRERLHNVIRFLCDGRYKALTGNDAIGREVWAMAERDAEIRVCVWDAYDRALSHLADLIQAAYRHVPAGQCRSTAYAILCLIEANEFFSGIGAEDIPSHAAEQSALTLLAALERQAAAARVGEATV